MKVTSYEILDLDNNDIIRADKVFADSEQCHVEAVNHVAKIIAEKHNKDEVEAEAVGDGEGMIVACKELKEVFPVRFKEYEVVTKQQAKPKPAANEETVH